MENYRVYVRVDENSRVVAINSNIFLQDAEGWVEIDRGYGDRYHHAQSNYLTEPLMDVRGICRYKLEGGKIVQRTADEMQSDVKAPDKSEIEKRIETIEKTVKVISDLLAKLGMK